ncbi:MAG TPA: hypothetical protein DCE44_09950 [Verrucomicrobiales bacterium]|nr:hypothetical protein [Verrucomicrobiales bacterium]
MPTTLTIRDETSSGQTLRTFTLADLTERMTVRELLRARIWQEVQDHNRAAASTAANPAGHVFRGLVQPTNTEQTLNGFKFSKPRVLDWEEQFRRACEAFERNGFFVLVGDHQAVTLDEEFEVKADTEVAFVKLVPLVGG